MAKEREWVVCFLSFELKEGKKKRLSWCARGHLFLPPSVTLSFSPPHQSYKLGGI